MNEWRDWGTHLNGLLYLRISAQMDSQNAVARRKAVGALINHPTSRPLSVPRLETKGAAGKQGYGIRAKKTSFLMARLLIFARSGQAAVWWVPEPQLGIFARGLSGQPPILCYFSWTSSSQATKPQGHLPASVTQGALTSWF
jgi:hypothetical protein